MKFKESLGSLCLLAILLLTSCYNDSTYSTLKKMERIKSLGNEDPRKALEMLHTLNMGGEREYTRNKYDLLVIRLYDKANEIPTTDVVIKRLVEYFEKVGSVAEKQEVYYYAGSVYRDLQDTPRALGFFFKSLDYALAYKKACDPIMLRNTYSNLSWLFFRVQDYPNAVKFSIKELESCKQTGSDVVRPFVHLGASYRALDSVPQAMAMFDSAFAHIIQSGDIPRYQESLACLLWNYSDLEEIEKAKECINLLEGNPLEEFDEVACMAFALYYRTLGKDDSAVIYLKRVLDDAEDFANKFDAASSLFRIYNNAGDDTKALKYARVYMQLSDSLNFGKRQELAATVNNQYQYHLDQQKEQQLKDEKERYKHMSVIISLAALLLACVGYICYVRKRNRHLQVVVELSKEMQRLSDDSKELREEIREKEQELADASDELSNVKEELTRVNSELGEYNDALKEKETELAEKTEQNRRFFRMLHQSEMEEKAEDVIQTVRLASVGQAHMTSADWRRLYHAIDELYPTFKDRLLEELGTFSEQDMHICYLMQAGMSGPQIHNIVSLSRVTVWRWVKQLDWIYEVEEK